MAFWLSPGTVLGSNLHLRRKMHPSPFSMASTLQTSLKAAAKIIRQIDGQQLMPDTHVDEQIF